MSAALSIIRLRQMACVRDYSIRKQNLLEAANDLEQLQKERDGLAIDAELFRREKARSEQANHGSRDQRISNLGTGVTVGQLKRMIAKLRIPDGAKVKFAIGQPAPGWALLESVSFCRPSNEVSLW